MITLTEAQKPVVAKWLQDGSSLSEVQKRLASEFKISATYMDVRLLVIDLGLVVKEQRPPAKTPPLSAESPDAGKDADLTPDNKPGGGVPGAGVSLSLDRITKPGTLVSGTVRFSDGVSGHWFLDQTGRLGLDTGKQGYRPNPQDIQAFQQALQKELEKHGF